MASPVIERFWHDLTQAIKNNRITLPALPEVILSTRQLLDDPKATASQISKAISSDPSITMRLLRVVNSPLYRTRTPIEDIRSAVTRLGNVNVRSIIATLAMEQLYNTSMSGPVKAIMKENWEHSTHVAALSYFIARDYSPVHPLDPDDAMLAGLIHDIGVLPILEFVELVPDLLINDKALHRVIEVLHTRVGRMVLEKWHFPASLLSVVRDHEDLMRDPGLDPDLTDVVIVANMLSHLGTDHPHTRLDWTQVPAFKRLMLLPDETIEIIKNASEEIQLIRKLFTVN